MYTLPEVWVRVTGLPSDVITDYLSLWGVGTLFGKTLDVDMAFTRRNKRLRIKIGCLDRSLIPMTTDMFIRRGFFKLHFEVEEANGSQEVDMAEVNNDKGGNDDAPNEEQSKEGGNDMDMDPKGLDEGDTSSKDKQDGEVNINAIQGMHLHVHHLDEIKIGSLKVPLSPKGIPSSVQNLGEKEHLIIPLSHVKNLMQNDKVISDYHADLMPNESASGLPRVTSAVAQQLQLLGTLQAELLGTLQADNNGQRGLLTGSSDSSQRVHATSKGSAFSDVRVGSVVAAPNDVAMDKDTRTTQKILGHWASCDRMHVHGASDAAAVPPLVDTPLSPSLSVPKVVEAGRDAGQVGMLSAGRLVQLQRLAACESVGISGSSAAASAVQERSGGVLWPQKIQTEQESKTVGRPSG
jgi:hypothetical protein